MARHRLEPRRLPVGAAAGLAVVVALWCAGDGMAPAMRADHAGSAAAAPPQVPAGLAAAGTPPAPAPLAPPPAGAQGDGAAGDTGVPAPRPASPPARLEVERIGLADEPMELGRRPDRTLEVPPEGPGSPAGWYRDSPAPGQPGPAVFLGHVNATGGGPGVFADLHLLVPGDTVRVRNRDGSLAVFEVRDVQRYAKDTFPSLRVYGNTAGPELRLITCDGYDPASGSFDENLVVYAALAGG